MQPQNLAADQKPAILMLGVGGGSAIHQMNRLLNPRTITGIEIDPVHLYVAKKYFGLVADNINLVQADANTWLCKFRRNFDIIVDDLFIDAVGDPIRPFEPNINWLSTIEKRLNKSGIFIQNHLSIKTALEAAEALHSQFHSALGLTMPHYANVVLVMFRNPLQARGGRSMLMQQVSAINKKAAKKLKFSIRQIY